MMFSIFSLITLSLSLVSARYLVTPDMDGEDGEKFCKRANGKVAKVSKKDLEAVKYLLQSTGVFAVRISKKSEISKAKKKDEADVLYFDQDTYKWATIGDDGTQEIPTLCREVESSKSIKKRHAKRAKTEKKDAKKEKKEKAEAKKVFKKLSKEEEKEAFKEFLESRRQARLRSKHH